MHHAYENNGITAKSPGSASPTSLGRHFSGEEKIMIESRYQELLAAELRMSACGCGGVCRVCQNEPRPGSEEERIEFEEELSAMN